MAVERAASLVKLKDVLTKTCKNNKLPNIIDINIKIQDDLSHIFESLKNRASKGDLIVVFGSFYLLSRVFEYFDI